MEKRIQMIASLSGDAISYAPDQVLVVGVDIEEALAIAFCTDPPDEPRAKPLDGWDPWAAQAGEDDGVEQEPETHPLDEALAAQELQEEADRAAAQAAAEQEAAAAEEAESEAAGAGEQGAEPGGEGLPGPTGAAEGEEVGEPGAEPGGEGLVGPTGEGGEPVDTDAETRSEGATGATGADEETGAERATSPAAEQRETADKPHRRGRKPKPPKDEEPPAA